MKSSGGDQSKALRVGQLAKRWSVTVERVRRLIEAGHLAGTFEIPSSGRYGKTVRIPMEAVLAFERRWQCGDSHPVSSHLPDRRKELRNFPELDLAPDGERCEAAQCRDAHISE